MVRRTSYAGRASVKADLELSLKMDASMGADQKRPFGFGGLRFRCPLSAIRLLFTPYTLAQFFEYP
jgi:hypothetical protein